MERFKMDNNQTDHGQKICCGDKSSKTRCCAGDPAEMMFPSDDQLILNIVSAPQMPKVSTVLTANDKLGSCKARWGINRMNYKVTPGLYCVGEADSLSPVLVTANYKMTFDKLRTELSGLDAWILVLDTKGINVWCAAGKGTFGPDELVRRIKIVNLAKVVTHKTLILPQLGASGMSAHEVQKRSGFKVVYGPVRASDIKEFLKAGMKATAQMRKVKFNIYDRLVLTPMELVGTFKISLMIFGVLFLLNLLIGPSAFGMTDFYGYMGAVLVGCVLVPLLLPWIPGKAFAWKGWLLGFIWAAYVNVLNGWPVAPHYGVPRALAYMFILPALSAFLAMNFTVFIQRSQVYKSFRPGWRAQKT
jgi:hypothetical protein